MNQPPPLPPGADPPIPPTPAGSDPANRSAADPADDFAARDATPPDLTVPVVAETAQVRVETVETGRVRVRKEVEETTETLQTPLVSQHVTVEHVPIGQTVAAVPEVRQEGDVLIVPVVREVAVVEKRLVLVEEIHIRRTAGVIDWEEQVALWRETVHVERLPPTDVGPETSAPGPTPTGNGA